MPAYTSPLEEHQGRAKRERLQHSALMLQVRRIRRRVARALKAVSAAFHAREQLSLHAHNPAAFEQRAALHKDRFWRRIILTLLLLVIFVGECVVGAQTASWLLSGSDYAASLFFASLLLGMTVFIKWFTQRSESRIRDDLSALQPGQDGLQTRLHLRLWCGHAYKGLILLIVGAYYCGVFQSKVMLERRKEEVRISDANLEKFNNRLLTDTSTAPPEITAEQKHEVEKIATAAASGSLGLFAMLLIGHFMVLATDVRGIGGDVELWRFSPGRAQKRLQKLSAREEKLLRGLAITIRDAPPEMRPALIEEIQPVAGRIDALARRDAGVPPQEAAPQEPAAPPHSTEDGRTAAGRGTTEGAPALDGADAELFA